jgi:dTDP-4-amino-4,6-dideoxygalactose transaminase
LPPFAAVADQLREVLESGRVTNFGTYVRAFEQEASAYLGTHTATVSSNTIGLILALQALGVRGGERVILPSFTFAATAQAVLYAGGRPVFVEIDADFNVSLEDLDALLARYPDVRVVLPVHCYGLPCRVGDIQRIVDDAARRASHPIRVLYDAAHALGSATEGRLIGGSGDVEVFSLSATKTVVAMEGGLVSSRDPELVRSIRRMRNYGLDAHYEAGGPGLNGKMTEMQAIIGQYDLRRLGTLMEQRQLRARLYRDRILSEARSRVTAWPPATAHTFKDFTIILPDDLAPQRPSIVGFLR